MPAPQVNRMRTVTVEGLLATGSQNVLNRGYETISYRARPGYKITSVHLSNAEIIDNTTTHDDGNGNIIAWSGLLMGRTPENSDFLGSISTYGRLQYREDPKPDNEDGQPTIWRSSLVMHYDVY